MTGEQLKAWRTARGLSQEAMGAAVGMTGRAISNYERDDPPAPTVFRMAMRQAFGDEFPLDKETSSEGK